jgi:hypothetical protein
MVALHAEATFKILARRHSSSDPTGIDNVPDALGAILKGV